MVPQRFSFSPHACFSGDGRGGVNISLETGRLCPIGLQLDELRLYFGLYASPYVFLNFSTNNLVQSFLRSQNLWKVIIARAHNNYRLKVWKKPGGSGGKGLTDTLFGRGHTRNPLAICL